MGDCYMSKISKMRNLFLFLILAALLIGFGILQSRHNTPVPSSALLELLPQEPSSASSYSFKSLLESCPPVWKRAEGVEAFEKSTLEEQRLDISLVRFCLAQRGAGF